MNNFRYLIMNRPTFTVPLKQGCELASSSSSYDVRSVSTKVTQSQSINLPTKPSSSFLMYLEEERKKLVKRGYSMPDATNEAAKKWQTLPPSRKKVYDDKRTKAMLKYEASLEKINKRNEKKNLDKSRSFFEMPSNTYIRRPNS